MTAYILIAAILILGGTIATVGDRMGTRVGKARLSLFNLRPRQTAVLVTIITGSVISASTLAILFAVDEQLRTGVFQLEEIQNELRSQQQQLEATNVQKDQVEQELAEARAEQKAQQQLAEKRQAEAEKRLARTNQSLETAIAKQAETRAQLQKSQAQLSQVTSQFQQAQARLKTVTQQAGKLRAEIQQRQAELQQLVKQRDQLKAQIAKRDQEIAKLDQILGQRDRDIAERNQVILQREARLKQLETEQEYLEREAQALERDLQGLRQGNVALFRGQMLAAGVVRITNPSEARQAVDQLLREANRTAIQLTQPGIDRVSERVVNISNVEVEQLIKQIDDGRDYVVQVLAAGNYVLGEKPIQVFADVALNQKVFSAGEVLATVSANPATMTSEEVRRRVELLIGASRFRASSSGILGNTFQVGDDQIPTLINFFERLKQYNQAVELQAVAAEDIYTVGPLKVELMAVENGRVIFGTRQFEGNPQAPNEPEPTAPAPAPSNPPAQTKPEIQQRLKEWRKTR